MTGFYTYQSAFGDEYLRRQNKLRARRAQSASIYGRGRSHNGRKQEQVPLPLLSCQGTFRQADEMYAVPFKNTAANSKQAWKKEAPAVPSLYATSFADPETTRVRLQRGRPTEARTLKKKTDNYDNTFGTTEGTWYDRRPVIASHDDGSIDPWMTTHRASFVQPTIRSQQKLAWN